MNNTISAFTFDASAKTIDFTAFTGFDLARLKAIINITQRQDIYVIGTPGYGYSSFTSNVLTLDFDTTTHADTDELHFIYVVDIDTKLPNTVTVVPVTDAAGMPVRQVPADTWRVGFAGVGSGVISSDLQLVGTAGSGMAVSQSAGNLVITTGTTANSETLIRSVRTFKGAFTARYKAILSQRIANNNFSFELADLVGEGLSYTINSSTSVTVTFPTTNPFNSTNVGQFVHLSKPSGASTIPGRFAIASVSGLTVTFTVAGWPASGTGTCTLWGWNYHRVLYDGTSATSAKVDAQRNGWASGDTTITTVTSASPGHVMQAETDGQMVGYSDALVASNAAIQFTPRGSRIENLPDPNTELYLFIRVLNGTTNPASTTTFTVGFVSVEVHGNNKVFIAGATQAGAQFGMNVHVGNTHAVTQSGTWTLQPGNTANTTPWLFSPRPQSVGTGGLSVTKIISTASTNGGVSKASPGAIHVITATNTSASPRYLKLYNKATGPTVGTDAPLCPPILIPGNTAGGGIVISFPHGVNFSTGIAYAITGGIADTDATAIGLNEVAVGIYYA